VWSVVGTGLILACVSGHTGVPPLSRRPAQGTTMRWPATG
jgi:hypothetical protein